MPKGKLHANIITITIEAIAGAEVIGCCSEIIKDEELAKRVVESLNNTARYFKYPIEIPHRFFEKATESFASFLQANDIDLEVGDWLVIKKV